MLRFATLIFVLTFASLARAGGLCTGLECQQIAPAPVDRMTPAPAVAAPASSAARLSYENLVTGLWRSQANGTCLGTLGAWHLTPYHVIAQGEMFDIAGITGTASRIAVLARRVDDDAGAQFIFMPVSRNRVDVSGTIFGEPDRHLAALSRCRRGME